MSQAKFPAEWVPHAATWFTWPTNIDTWTDVLDPVRRKLAKAIVAIAEGEIVLVNVSNPQEAKQVHDLTENHPNVRTLDLPSNDSWCRDHGATFLLQESELKAVTWRYNAWGNKYPPFDLDDGLGECMAARMGIHAVQSQLTLEGGALESNGGQILLTTASSVLNPNRNPGLTQFQADQELSKQLGLPIVGWLSGDLEGDDTDGHIDNLARFTSERHILWPKALATPQNVDEVARIADLAGLKLTVDCLPEAKSLLYQGGPLPSSHMNFYIANACVILPTYGGPSDDEAAETLTHFFPSREIIQLDCRDVIRGLGAIHCLTQQVPLHHGFVAPKDDFIG
ncbi:MAG: agmatine deiminase family protein [Bacteroidetes bacterium]|nr:agmatine deiminase family protein [Bacteroidota bacterium]